MSAKTRLISCEYAAEQCGGISAATFRQRKAGTENLTHVSIGSRVMLIREEFEDWLEREIAKAKADHRKNGLRLVKGAV